MNPAALMKFILINWIIKRDGGIKIPTFDSIMFNLSCVCLFDVSVWLNDHLCRH